MTSYIATKTNTKITDEKHKSQSSHGVRTVGGDKQGCSLGLERLGLETFFGTWRDRLGLQD